MLHGPCLPIARRVTLATERRLLLLLLLAAVAAAQLPWHQDFEDQLPGQSPRGWSVAWGDPGDDLLLVSNLRALTGAHSLLLDRQSGEQSPMAGYSTRFANAPNRWVAFAVGLLIQGKADSVRFGLELRGANPGDRVLAVGIDGRKVSLTAVAAKESVALGEYEEDGWHRLRLWLPTAGGGQKEAMARLDSRQPGQLCRVPCQAPPSGWGTFMPVTYPGKRGYLLFLDDLSAAVGDAPN